MKPPERNFPPGVSWLPYAVAAGLAILVSAVVAIPRFGPQTIGQTIGPGTVAASATPGANASAGPSGTSVINPGQAGRAGSGGPGSSTAACRNNGGATAPGVDATTIHIASTVVNTGDGSDFLKEASHGMLAAVNEVNRQGGICGRRLTFQRASDPSQLNLINTQWNRQQGNIDISGFIHDGSVFALVGEPDSEGLAGALDNNSIDAAGMPVVGTDGMLKDQYTSPWVWPVAAATVTNMRIIVKYARAHGAKTFGIVYDNKYKFGGEGAAAYYEEVKREGGEVPGYQAGTTCNQGAYCGVSADDTANYSTYVNNFNKACGPCDAVVMLLEPTPFKAWMQLEESNKNAWYTPGNLYGGEPLFDDKVAGQCQNCNHLTVWTGYHPAIQPFDGEPAVYTYCQSLHSVGPNDDCHNEFTQGAYLGTKLFIAAAQKVGPNLTREALKQALDSNTFDLGLSSRPIQYGGSLPHLTNICMVGYSDNFAGSFNGWNFLADTTGFICDPNPRAGFG